MAVEITSECHRRGTLGLIGEATGARLCTAEGEILYRERLFEPDGSICEKDMISQDSNTGLIVPNLDTANMLLSDGITNIPVPPMFFVHPQTARTMPIEGTISNFLKKFASL